MISADRRTLSVNLSNGPATDDMRVMIATAQASLNIAPALSGAFTVSAVP